MSADNWGVCPRCKVRIAQEKEAKHVAAAKAYGKVSPDEWRQMLKDAEVEPREEATLREDYEIRTSASGAFYVSYSCRCETCGFRHKFKHEEQLPL